MKQHTRIHAKHQMTNSEWDELHIDAYQHVELADDVDDRIFFDCFLASLRGAIINMVQKKVMQKQNEKN